MLIPNVRTCSRCVMDTSAPDITFDEEGICNYCSDFLREYEKFVEPDPAKRKAKLDALVETIKERGKGKRYDCIVGVSGGVDSSWTLVQAVRLGLRPLAVHMDSGWNSELAQNNIANLVRQLGVDLYTHVIDWPEIRGLMEAFFAADVIDVEVLYDNAMIATNYGQARKHGVRYILAGSNMATEGVQIPRAWNWLKTDRKNIVGISKRFGGPKLKTFPSIGTVGFMRDVFVHRVRWIAFLDYLDYRKSDVLGALQAEFGYKPYAYKHYESVFTRFFQGYILPEKFGVDKRKPHLSNLVMTGEMMRDEALEKCRGLAYPSQKELDADIRYFKKKMMWSDEKFEDYMRRPEKAHTDYPSEAWLGHGLIGLYRRLNRKVGKKI